jgi:hypothetical protein
MVEVMLGGIPIAPLASGGFPDHSYDQDEEGVAEGRRSGGALVVMVHFRKALITISGSGLMGLGFDGLDYEQPLELRCTAARTLSTASLSGVIPGTVRPDQAPWATARVGNREIPTPVDMVGNSFTITPVAGALGYRVSWMPSFMVRCRPPVEAIQQGAFPYSWTFTAREV